MRHRHTGRDDASGCKLYAAIKVNATTVMRVGALPEVQSEKAALGFENAKAINDRAAFQFPVYMPDQHKRSLSRGFTHAPPKALFAGLGIPGPRCHIVNRPRTKGQSDHGLEGGGHRWRGIKRSPAKRECKQVTAAPIPLGGDPSVRTRCA